VTFGGVGAARAGQVKHPPGVDQVRVGQGSAVGEPSCFVESIELAPPEARAELAFGDPRERVPGPYAIRHLRRLARARLVEHIRSRMDRSGLDQHRSARDGKGRGCADRYGPSDQGAPDGELDQAAHDLGREDRAHTSRHSLPRRVPDRGDGRRCVKNDGEGEIGPKPPRQEPDESQHCCDRNEGARKTVRAREVGNRRRSDQRAQRDGCCYHDGEEAKPSECPPHCWITA